MQETWTTRHSDIELDGYSHPIHSFRRFQNKRAKRASGGVIIYIKDNIRKGVKLIKNEVDCLIWLKFDKCFFQISEDIYLCVAYIPPENSVFHNMFDGDIFRLLEDDISLYQNSGKMFLTGDLNGRTSIKPDFIENDRSIIIQNDVNQVDTPIPRFSLDRGSNRFGDSLLDLCKATNMRIVNSRLHKDQGSGRFTCFTHNGESVVDYLITLPQNFTLISEFQVHDFTEYSNHVYYEQ